jgi:hypothetical protein
MFHEFESLKISESDKSDTNGGSQEKFNDLKGKRMFDTYYIKKDVPAGMSICINQEDEDFAKLNF